MSIAPRSCCVCGIIPFFPRYVSRRTSGADQTLTRVSTRQRLKSIHPTRKATMLRKILAIALAVCCLLMLISALTVPAFAATAPAILAVALGVATWFAWPKHRGNR
jgi:hypothetical protein